MAASTKIQSALQAAGNSKAFSSNVAVGNLLTARIVWQGAAGITLNSVTDSLGNTWTVHAATLEYNSTLTQYMQIASAPSGSAGACTVTANLSTGAAKSIAIDEWNNVGGTPAFSSGAHNKGLGSVLSSGSATASQSNSLGISMCGCDGSVGNTFTTPNAGWTDQQSYTPYWYANDLYQLDLGSTGSKSAGETLVSGLSKNWMCNLAIFEVSSSPAINLTPAPLTEVNPFSTNSITQTQVLGAAPLVEIGAIPGVAITISSGTVNLTAAPLAQTALFQPANVGAFENNALTTLKILGS
ncbi:MAG TPA: hypothetical protein VFS89_06935 [Nitrosospira sp.]|nr:hypothetical protein [Nitrosospira sp.]